jgi:antibiotic biosynthesis monooxygenase (ABM) superfamily enzyme
MVSTEVNGSSTTAGDEPVVVSVARAIKPGREAEYEAVVAEMSQAASQIPGYLVRDIFRPQDKGAPGSREYHVVLRFDHAEHLRDWENSPERAALMARADALTQGQARSERVDGMEGWFSLPEHEHNPKPPKWKNTLLTVICVFILLSVVAPVIRHFTESWPTPLANLLSACILAPCITYLVMPTLTRLFKGWLYPAPAKA